MRSIVLFRRRAGRMYFETIGFGSLECCETMECSSVIRRPKTAA